MFFQKSGKYKCINLWKSAGQEIREKYFPHLLESFSLSRVIVLLPVALPEEAAAPCVTWSEGSSDIRRSSVRSRISSSNCTSWVISRALPLAELYQEKRKLEALSHVTRRLFCRSSSRGRGSWQIESRDRKTVQSSAIAEALSGERETGSHVIRNNSALCH
jgi:hypothetical protein